MHRSGKLHIEGRMETNPSAIELDYSDIKLDSNQSSLSQPFQLMGGCIGRTSPFRTYSGFMDF